MRAPSESTGYRLGHVVLGVALGVATLGYARTARSDDRAEAQALVQSIDPASNDAARQALAALERATRMRGAGDEAHARLAEGLALEWAELARDRERTLRVEKEARAAEVAAIDAGARVERERALFEEAIARGGRLRAELAKVTAQAGAQEGRDHPKTFVGSGRGTPNAPKATPARGATGHSPLPPSPHVDADAPGTDGAHGGGGAR